MRLYCLLLCTLTSFHVSGQDLFDDSVLHQIRFTGVDTLSLDFSKTEQLVTVHIDGVRLDSVGFREKGNISLFHANRKRPFKVKTNRVVRGQKVSGINEFTLHNSYEDPSLMREKLSYDLAADLGLLALRTAFAEVYLNEVYWGVYTIVEAKDELFKRALGDRDADAIESLDLGTMCYRGPNGDDYRGDDQTPLYTLENGDEARAFERFADMMDAVNNTSDAQYLDQAGTALNLDDWFAYQAFNVYLLNADSYLSFYGNQVYGFDSLRQQWQVIPWDFNASIGLWDTDRMQADAFPILPARITNGCVANRVTSVPALREQYLSTLCRLQTDFASADRMDTRIDAYEALLRDAVQRDWRKDFTNAEFDAALGTGTQQLNFEQVPGLRGFFSAREALVATELAAAGYSCAPVNTVDVEQRQALEVYPNPARDRVFVDGLAQSSGIMQLYRLDGAVVRVEVRKGWIELSELSSGIYVLREGDRAAKVVVLD